MGINAKSVFPMRNPTQYTNSTRLLPSILVFLIASLASPTHGASRVGNNIPLGQGIAFTEFDDGNKPRDLVNAADVYEADVNSTLLIKLDALAIAASLPQSEAVRAPTPPTPPETVQKREQLFRSLSTLNDYLSICRRIAVLFENRSTGTAIPGLPELMSQHGTAYIRLQDDLLAYLTVSQQDSKQGKSAVDVRDELFEGPLKVWSSKVQSFLQEEIQRLDQESARRLAEIKANANPFSLQLSAELVRKGERIKRIHLPGYDSHEEGEYKPIDKISFSMPDEEKKKLQSEMDFNREIASRLNETRDLRKSLLEALSRISETAISRARTFCQETRNTSNEIQALVTSSIIEERAQGYELLEGEAKPVVDGQLKEFQRIISSNVDAVRTFQTTIEQRLPTATKLASLQEANDPIDVLDQFLKLTTEVPSTLNSAYNELQQQSEVIRSSFTNFGRSLESSIKSLSGAARTAVDIEKARREKLLQDIRSKLEVYKASQVDPFVDFLEGLKRNADKLRSSAVPTLALSKGLDPSLIDEKTIIRAFGSIIDTKISIPRSGRIEGDQIELHIVARQSGPAFEPIQKAPILGERVPTFTLKKFGAYSEFSTGAAAFFNTVNSNKTEFGALTTWVLHKRSRTSSAWNIVNTGIGMHAAGISSGLGIGASLHLFPGNFFQAGGGRTMRSTGDNQWYWFVGLRLANFKMPTMSN